VNTQKIYTGEDRETREGKREKLELEDLDHFPASLYRDYIKKFKPKPLA
jgi:hypothetical protein